MKTFNICNKYSGHDFGNYQGETEAEALDALARDAGYADFNEAREVVGAGDDLIISEVA